LNRIALVLLGLFVTMSGVVSATAYISNNNAFVAAQTIISVDFGSAFPGQVVTESFTIDNKQNDTMAYILTIIPPGDPAVEDMSPYLSVWKDPAEEAETDGEADGLKGDFTADGSFTNPGDLSDKWMVTFYVPDVTLPNDSGLDYGCQIKIEPRQVPEG
jgi:hypothetical protein